MRILFRTVPAGRTLPLPAGAGGHRGNPALPLAQHFFRRQQFWRQAEPRDGVDGGHDPAPIALVGALVIVSLQRRALHGPGAAERPVARQHRHGEHQRRDPRGHEQAV